MDNFERKRIEAIWKQSDQPVIVRLGGSNPLRIRLPYLKRNRAWLTEERKRKPVWSEKYKCWEMPKTRFNDLASKILKKYGSTYIIQPFRAQEKCAPACWKAKGHECECSCMGEYHGSQGPNGDWLVVSDTFATQWHGKELACRLLTGQVRRLD